ncbi:MAG: protein kinase, partial [Phycisphaerales bacterium]|nr:protein kinase [Phycisphaerales bacterium]
YEAQTLGRLRHDNIAQIYEAGTHDDGSGARPFFAMEYIAGAKPLTTYAADKKLGTRERLELFSKVCDAVQHGHQKGIIHRDLKPPNILVTSSGVPKIIDFGVARSTDSDLAVTTLQTDVGALIGTLQYMSPEQCAADPNDIDTRSDVYALGVILFELLCESLPYDLTRVAIAEAARIVQQEEPTKPSTVDKRLRGDVEIIALKALEKDRDRRYQSATALEDDITRYLAGEAITAKAPSAIDYLRRFARKHKAAAISMAAIFVVLAGAVIAISIFAVEADSQRKIAEEQRKAADVQRQAAETATAESQQQAKNAQAAELSAQGAWAKANIARKFAEEKQAEAEQQRDEARRQAYFGNIHAADAALQAGILASANQRLDAANKAMGDVPAHELPFEWRYLDAQADYAIATLPGHEHAVLSVTFSPDGTRLASGSYDNTIRLWDTDTGEELSVLGHEDFVLSVTFSPDGTRLASGSVDNTIRIWDTDTGEELSVLPGHEDSVWSVTFSPDGTRLASGSYDNTIRIWDTRSRGRIAYDRRLARQRAAELAPLVDSWVEKANGDDELVIAMLDREVMDRTPEEATTLRNLVLKKLSEHRQARETEAAQPAVP